MTIPEPLLKKLQDFGLCLDDEAKKGFSPKVSHQIMNEFRSIAAQISELENRKQQLLSILDEFKNYSNYFNAKP